MDAKAWNNGEGTYGIRVGFRNRDQFFNPDWTEIKVEVDGAVHTFPITRGFWNRCPEFRDSGSPVIREWLRRHHSLPWPKRHPPRFELIPVGDNRFRLVA